MLDFNSFYQISRLFLNELAFQSFLRIPQLQHWIRKGYMFSTPVGGLERKSTYINTCRWIGSLLLEDKYFGKLNSHTSLPQPPPQPHPPELPGIEHLMVPEEVKNLLTDLLLINCISTYNRLEDGAKNDASYPHSWCTGEAVVLAISTPVGWGLEKYWR